ncbi:hypothetical protein EEP46_25905 [Escherichia coli]|nr:hypothetical protein [Escherichia coli]
MKKKFKKWLPGRTETTGWKESPLKQTDRHHKSPGGDLCIRDRLKIGDYRRKSHCCCCRRVCRSCLRTGCRYKTNKRVTALAG